MFVMEPMFLNRENCSDYCKEIERRPQMKIKKNFCLRTTHKIESKAQDHNPTNCNKKKVMMMENEKTPIIEDS